MHKQIVILYYILDRKTRNGNTQRTDLEKGQSMQSTAIGIQVHLEGGRTF